MFNPINILVPTDFSDTAEKAFQDAIDIARRNNAVIYLLHVNELIYQCTENYCLDADLVEQIGDKTMSISKERLKKLIDKFPAATGLSIRADVKKGDPYDEILKEQEAKKIDLIVIAAHKRKGLSGHMLGSVAEKVTRAANCPVLVVKG
jgi:universal stress protein A